jgi:hypothetical protein
VRKLRPFAFDHRSHFIGDMVDMLDFEHVLVQPSQGSGHHDLAADNAGLIGRRFLLIPVRQVSGRMPLWRPPALSQRLPDRLIEQTTP